MMSFPILKIRFTAFFKKNYLTIGFFTFWFIYMVAIWGRMFICSKQNDLLVRHVGVWGDWAVHMTMGSAMVFRSLFLPESPLILGFPFRYPFLANLFSAVLVRIGVPFFTAFSGPSFIFSLMFITALYMFYRFLFRSERVGIISSFIFIFNGGWGFLYYLVDIYTSEHPLKTFFFPPRAYTNMDDGHLKWTSTIDSMLIPQRAFQLGFPLGIFILMFIWRARNLEIKGTRKAVIQFGLIGFLFGLLTIAHTHSFIAVGMAISFWCAGDLLWKRWQFLKEKGWLWVAFLIGFGLSAAPLLYFFPLFSGGHIKGMLWYPGWFAREWEINVFGFWWNNWGVTLLGALAGFVWKCWATEGAEQKFNWFNFMFPFFFLFILSNLVMFHPWIWDNTKFITWASLAFSGFAGYFIVKLAWPKHVA